MSDATLATSSDAAAAPRDVDELHFPPSPHASYYTSPGTVELTDENRSKLESVRANLAEELKDSENKAFVDDRCIRRYLVARNWNVDKATEMLRNTLTWRKSYKPHLISPTDMEKEASWGLMYRRGFDKRNRPVLLVRPAKKSSEDWDTQLRHIVWNFESAIATMAEGVEQIVWLVDYRNFSLIGAPPLSFGKQVMSTLADHYPERLGHVFALDPPMIFRFFWTAISPFIHQQTKDKILFLTGSDKAKRLAEYFDEEDLEEDFTGKNKLTYNHEKYWKKAAEHYDIRSKWWQIKCGSTEQDSVQHTQSQPAPADQQNSGSDSASITKTESAPPPAIQVE